ncbi:MAG: zinc-binding dehydrogenase [Planctomycetes bacterium]|nr:zinc-binding dehydrogenase [Planctomycetota bacterium]
MKSRAIIFPKKGKAVLDEVDIGEPGDDQVLVKNAGCGICQVEIKKFKGLLDDAFPQKQLGHEGVGTIVRAGKAVKDFKEGDRITTLWYNGFTEYNVADLNRIRKIPLQHEADFPYWISEPAACAVNGYKGCEINPSSRILLIGAGYMGLLLLQVISRSLADEIVVADLDKSKLAMAKRFGAGRVFDSGSGDLAAMAKESGKFDIVIEATGASGMIEQAASLCGPRGQVIVFGDHRPWTCQTRWAFFAGLTLKFTQPGFSPDFFVEWRQACRLIERGVIRQKDLISHIFKAKHCQVGMDTAVSRAGNYIKGYFTWL